PPVWSRATIGLRSAPGSASSAAGCSCRSPPWPQLPAWVERTLGPMQSEVEAGLSAEPEDELVRVELDGAQRKKKTGKGRIIAIVLSVVVIGGVFAFALPRIANYGDVWDVVQGLSWEWIVLLLAAVVLN